MSEQKNLSPRAWSELILLGVIWGASFVSIRVALDEVPVVTSVLHRTFWAMLVLWVAVLVMRLPLPRDPRVWGAFLVMGLLNNVIPFSLMAWGQLHVESGLTSILNAATAIFGVIVAAMVFPDERLTAHRAIGVALGFAGVAAAIGLRNFTSFDPRNLAQLAILAGTLSYAFAGAWARLKLSFLPPQVAAAGMLTGSTLTILPMALLIDGPPSLELQPITWAAIAYYSLIATAGAYLLYYRVLAMAGAGNLLLVTLIIPPVAILLGAALRDEVLGPQAYGGFALLALGLVVLNRSGRRRD
ncbi:DMT family transporter [Ruegeria sediminis]|uniref:DMT family transporter n=1 Tax=Ruegeria sediminis TaxID=2583820 RepID=A0ABY2X1F6_9RHOB|nr:DMT family transporter [Ruegeria sediminis]TMV08668.1 DMT family transporter [Ruegeria sediminis]